MGTLEATSGRETLMGNKSDLPQTTMFIKKWLNATLKPLQRFAGQKEKLTDY